MSVNIQRIFAINVHITNQIGLLNTSSPNSIYIDQVLAKNLKHAEQSVTRITANTLFNALISESVRNW